MLLVSRAKSLICIYILIVLQKNATAAIIYNQLMQEFARRSAHFCEKACTGGLIHLLLVNLQHFVIVSAPEVSRCKLAFKVLIFNFPLPNFRVSILTTVLSKKSIILWYVQGKLRVFLNNNSNMTLWQIWQDWKLAAACLISRLFPNVIFFYLKRLNLDTFPCCAVHS